MKLITSAVLASAILTVQAGMMPRTNKRSATLHSLNERAAPYPAAVQNYTTIKSPTGVTIRYKEPGKAGVCETTPGVNSYSGYIELSPTMHSFFWFFESRSDPSTDPVTLWLNGGPGSDSQIGLFQGMHTAQQVVLFEADDLPELGPCMINKKLKSYVNPYSWSNVSNMIFLSQPYGVGFSNQGEAKGSLNDVTGAFVNSTSAKPDGRYPLVNATEFDTTEIAAVAAWHVIQGFYSGLPKLDSAVKSTEFNLWTESYGGHYGERQCSSLNPV